MGRLGRPVGGDHPDPVLTVGGGPSVGVGDPRAIRRPRQSADPRLIGNPPDCGIRAADERHEGQHRPDDRRASPPATCARGTRHHAGKGDATTRVTTLTSTSLAPTRRSDSPREPGQHHQSQQPEEHRGPSDRRHATAAPRPAPPPGLIPPHPPLTCTPRRPLSPSAGSTRHPRPQASTSSSPASAGVTPVTRAQRHPTARAITAGTRSSPGPGTRQRTRTAASLPPSCTGYLTAPTSRSGSMTPPAGTSNRSSTG